LDGPPQRRDLILQGLDVTGRHPDLDVKGVTLAAD
jgi:hypothetical protein